MPRHDEIFEVSETETLLPLSVLVSRLEKHRDEMLAEVKRTPWWNLRRKWIARGSASAYEYELRVALELGGKHNLARMGIPT